jgi:hypothetical protein
MPIHYFIRSFLRVTGGNCDELFPPIEFYDESVLYQIQTKESDQVEMLHRRGLLENDVTYVPGCVAGGLESVRVAGVDGRPTMAERGAEGGIGTTFTTFQKLKQRVTQMQTKGDFDGNIRGLKGWKGTGTPKENSKDKEERDVRKFRNNHTSRLRESLKDLEEYAPHATVKESDDISAWIVFVRDRKNRLEAAWKIRTDQEAKKKAEKKKK